jgi:ubiquinone/menaquinone biosynthesis C-methylase UbiE
VQSLECSRQTDSFFQMSWLDLRRVPEPEVMDDSGEVEAYFSAAAEAYLSRIDGTFVEHALRLLAGRDGSPSPARGSGRALDIGSGPGQIVLKLASRLPGWDFIGVDRSPNMIRQALAGRREGSHVEFLLADGCRLPFADASFDLVLCNSVLHHLEHPQALLSEMARIARPAAALLVRDLRRPPRFAYPLHVRWYGRRYSGLMYKLYCDSVHAAYTPGELAMLLGASPLRGARVFTQGRTHMGIERPAR